MRKKKTAPETASEQDQLSAVVDTLAKQKQGDTPAPKTKKQLRAERRAEKARIRSDRALRKKAKKLVIPRTVQETIPYSRVYPDSGIIETADGVFTKTYILEDINYKAAKDEAQDEIYRNYSDFHNSFDSGMVYQIMTIQQAMNVVELEANTLMKMEMDERDAMREEYNNTIRKHIREVNHLRVKNRYATVSAKASSYEQALSLFNRLDGDIVRNFKRIGGAVATPLSSARRLELLHDIYNPNSVGLFGNSMHYDRDGKLVFDKEKFRFDIMRRMGLSTKDVIAPPSFTFKSDYGMVGSVYFRVLFLKTFPQQVQDDLLREITDADCKMVTTLTYRPIDMDSAIKMVKNDIINVNANMIDKQKQASKSGYSVDLINPDLKSAVEEANALLEDLTARNQKMFFMNMVIVHFADSKKQLDLDTKAIQDIGAGRLVNIQPLTWQQENGLNACLPLCTNKLEIWRTLTTESAAVFMPFVNQELFDRSGGMYYGINAISRHLIILDRRLRKNGNGLILGSPGSGKSLAAKLEILHVFLSSKDVIIVIDPEGEYYRMAELLGGEVIKIAPGSGIHINPFDNELTIHDDTRDLVTQKSDFISSIFDSIMGSFSVSPTQHSVIDRCVELCYGPYFASYDASTGTYDKSKVPTLVDFYECLREQPGYEAMQLADALEIYAVGSLDFFAQKTNVEYTKRFVVYDISEISNTMKSFGQLVVLDNIWNRMVSGRKEGRNVWFYIDEVYLLFKSGYSTEFLRNLYKRARKYGGIPTGITQNVTDILKNETARTMIANCEFVQMLSQSADDQAALASILPISPSEMTYITNAPPGQGLIYDGVHIVPFINEVDKNSKIYEAMTTNLAEVKAIEDRKKAEKAVQTG